MTEWRKVPGFSRYSASSDGQIRLDVPYWGRAPRVLASRVHQHYLRVHVAHDLGFSARVPVHRLVALAFLGNPPFLGAFVLHGDGDHGNNAASNLRYGTPKENSEDSVKHGVQVHGERVNHAKLNDRDVLEIVKLLWDGVSQSRIANGYGVCQRVIWQIAAGQKWKHITKDLQLPPLPGKGYRGRVTQGDVDEIRRLGSLGEPAATIAPRFGITKWNVYAILRGTSWRDRRESPQRKVA